MTRLIKLGGAVCATEQTLDALATAWTTRAGPADTWVLVHGGGPQLDAALLDLEGPPVKVDGLRVTSPRAATVVQQTLDAVGARMVAGLAARGVPATHVASLQKRLHAVPKDARVDLGRVGTATGFDAHDLPHGVLVVTPVGFDAQGPLNVNADEAALVVARALGVERLILATDVPHVLDADGQPIERLDPPGVLDLIQGGAAHGGMVPKLKNALLAVESGVAEAVVGTLAAAWDGTGTSIRLVHPEHAPAPSRQTEEARP